MRDFQKPGRSAVYADNGMVATSHPLAAQVAIGLLQQGGTAVDAAIGAAVLLGLCEPQMTGLGGDAFVLIKPPGEDRVVAMNGSGRAPKGLSAAAMRAAGHAAVPVYGVEAITLPGAVDAFCRLNADWGRLELAQVLAPAIRYFDAGVPVAPRVAQDWAEAMHLRLQGAARDHFLKDGRALRTGERFALPGQAEVLRRIARQGRAGFYEGEVAEDMVASLRALGGSHTLDDFAAVAGEYTEPVTGLYRGTELVEHAPNGQGATAILLLNILSHFDLSALDPLGAARVHLEAEATRLAYDARNRFLADADHTTRLAHMLAPETAARLAALIDPGRAIAQVAPLTEAVHKDTILITVVDRDRMAVSLIYSIFWFGHGLDPVRHRFSKSRRRVHPDRGPPERGRRRQAADAYDHSRHGAAGWQGGDALWRDGWGLSTGGARAHRVEHGRLWHGRADGDRRAAGLCRALLGSRRAGAGDRL